MNISTELKIPKTDQEWVASGFSQSFEIIIESKKINEANLLFLLKQFTCKCIKIKVKHKYYGITAYLRKFIFTKNGNYIEVEYDGKFAAWDPEICKLMNNYRRIKNEKKNNKKI